MADHARTQVRDAAAADLAGLHTTAANVFSGRIGPLAETELPGLNVLLQDETSDFDTMSSSGGTIARTGRLVVEGWAQGNDDLDDLLDTIAAEVETRIYSPVGMPTLRALLMNFGPPTTQIDYPEQPQGRRRIGRLRLLFPVVYRTALADPTTIA